MRRLPRPDALAPQQALSYPISGGEAPRANRGLSGVVVVSPKTNCAGQYCDEREGCRRYGAMIADGIKVVNERQLPVFAWASFDLERAFFGGECPHFIRMVHA